MSKCPTGKRRFHDEAEAKRVLGRIQTGEKRATTPTRVYRCPRCGGWHLTSQERKSAEEWMPSLRRSAPLKPGKGLQRRTGLNGRKRPLRAVSQARVDESPEYEAAKATVLLRDRGVCQAEGMDGVPHGGPKDPHHVCPTGRQGPRCEPENMTTLCRAAHDWAHAHPRKALELGLLLHAGATLEDMRYAALLRANARGENLEGEPV